MPSRLWQRRPASRPRAPSPLSSPHRRSRQATPPDRRPHRPESALPHRPDSRPPRPAVSGPAVFRVVVLRAVVFWEAVFWEVVLRVVVVRVVVFREVAFRTCAGAPARLGVGARRVRAVAEGSSELPAGGWAFTGW